MRKPDNIILSWPWKSFCIGFTYQKYHTSASCFTLCLGILTLRWHRR